MDASVFHCESRGITLVNKFPRSGRSDKVSRCLGEASLTFSRRLVDTSSRDLGSSTDWLFENILIAHSNLMPYVTATRTHDSSIAVLAFGSRCYYSSLAFGAKKLTNRFWILALLHGDVKLSGKSNGHICMRSRQICSIETDVIFSNTNILEE